MPKDGSAPLSSWLVDVGEHTYLPTSDEDGRARWECSCGKVGRWGKTAERLHPGWLEHAQEAQGEAGSG